MERDEIYHRYGWQFTADRRIDSSVPDEWLPAIASLCAGVDKLVQDELRKGFHWLDIKEKRGQLAVDYAPPAALADAIDVLVETAESACREIEPSTPTKSKKRSLDSPPEEVQAAAQQAGEAAIKWRLDAGLSVSGLDAAGRIVHDTREQADDAGAYQDNATPLTDALQSHARLIAVNALNWQGQEVPVWLPIGDDGKVLCGAILYLEDMPPALCKTFKHWLAQQVLSISRPPLGLPRKGQAYFLEDVLTAVESST